MTDPPSRPIEIVPLHPHHWPAVRHIYTEGLATDIATFETKVPSWERWDETHLPCCRLVALEEGTVVAWAALSPVSARPVYVGVAEVSIYVASTARGRGIGTRLLRALVVASEAAGIWTLQSTIFTANEQSVRLHHRCGFRTVGRRDRLGQREGIWHDVLLLERRSDVVGGHKGDPVARSTRVKRSYDRVAATYAAQFYGELAQKPLDREMLDRLVEEVGPKRPICDMGCGPGQIARYLHERGASACGIDLSSEMVSHAQRLAPDIPFCQGDMLDLSAVDDNALGGIAAFYSVIHVPRGEVPCALGELYRVLRPGGLLLLAFHIGRETRHLDEWWGEPVALDFHFYETEEMTSHLHSAAFEIDAVLERDPYPTIEVQTRRAYLFARKRPG